MTEDLRERLQDLASEMPAMRAPADLERRVQRREFGTIAGAATVVIVAILLAWAGLRSFDRSAEEIPAKQPAHRFPGPGPPQAASKAVLQGPDGLMVDPAGGLFISEWYGNKLNVMAPDGSLGIIAGDGTPGYGGDGGPATNANIDSPTAMVLDGDGSLLFVDNGNSCIRRIDRRGTITTVAGICGSEGYSGDGGPALEAQLSRPLGLVLDPEGGFYFSDNDFGLVRHVDAKGQMSTIAGAGGVSPLDVGPEGVEASSIDLGRTSYVLLDPQGNLYVTDLRPDIVVEIDPGGIARVIAGTGRPGYSGDGGPAVDARLNLPAGLAMDEHGNLYVDDSGNNVVREIRSDGRIRTVVGTGLKGESGDGGPASHAHLNAPSGLAFAGGNLYIADQGNDIVLRVDPSGIITTIAGSMT